MAAIEQIEQTRSAQEVGSAHSSKKSGSSGMGWASKWTKKASTLAAGAKEALVKESRLVAEDAKELAAGMHEGWKLTAQDTRMVAEKIREKASDTKASGLQNPFGARSFRGLIGSRGVEAQVAEAGDGPGAASGVAPQGPADDVEITPADAPAEAEVENDAMQASAPGSLQGPAAPALQDRIKQSFTVTANVSRDVWRDIREESREVVGDFKNGVREIGQAVSSLQTSSAAAEEVPTAEPEPSETDSGAGDELDGRSASDRKPDDQAAKAAERAKKAAQLAASVSGELWRKTTGGIKAGLQQAVAALPEQQQPEGERDEEELAWELPSTRANYVQLEVMDADVTGGSQSAKAQMDAAAAMKHAELKARKLGGAFAKRSKEVSKSAAEASKGLLQQAKDLSQNIQASASTGVAAVASGTAAGGSTWGSGVAPELGEAAAFGASGEDAVFEIGDDEAVWEEDDDPFAGMFQEGPLAAAEPSAAAASAPAAGAEQEAAPSAVDAIGDLDAFADSLFDADEAEAEQAKESEDGTTSAGDADRSVVSSEGTVAQTNGVLAPGNL